MNPADDRFLTAALAEDGMPISAGSASSTAPSDAEREQFDSALADAQRRFLTAALAEDGMPISAGYVPADGLPSSPDSDRPETRGEEIARLQRWTQVVFAEIQNLPAEYRAPVSAVLSALHEGGRINTQALVEPFGYPWASIYDRLGRGLTLLGERLRNHPEIRDSVTNPVTPSVVRPSCGRLPSGKSSASGPTSA